jgi:cyclophilin family peptidyl-prolyl cis-trans isomerase
VGFGNVAGSMGTDKRARQKAGRQARLAEAQAAAARRKRTRSGLLLAGLVVVLVAVTLVIGGLGSDDDETVAADGGSTTTVPESTTTTDPYGTASECPATDGSSPQTLEFPERPPLCIDAAKTYTATVSTSHGDFTLELDDEAAPVTVNNFVFLARYHYYDGTTFHRIIPQFMIQGGDATGDPPGTGGPGYAIADELPTGEDAYPPGTLAMANSGPNSSGSQFFVMATGSTGLANDYSVFGRVVTGQDVVDAINLLGDAATNGTPTEEVTITTITITEA